MSQQTKLELILFSAEKQHKINAQTAFSVKNVNYS